MYREGNFCIHVPSFGDLEFKYIQIRLSCLISDCVVAEYRVFRNGSTSTVCCIIGQVEVKYSIRVAILLYPRVGVGDKLTAVAWREMWIELH